MTHGQPDNIDAHKEVILKKLNDVNYFVDVPNLLGDAPKLLPFVN
jgi:hypothetical protein